MPAVNAFQCKQQLFILTCPKCNVWFIDQTYNTCKPEKIGNNVANVCNWTFYQC